MIKNPLFHIALFTPLAMALLWLGFVLNLAAQAGADIILSPSRSQPLVTGLIIFVVGYIIFLGLIYSEELKKWLTISHKT